VISFATLSHANSQSSWLCHFGSPTSRAQKAWSPQGAQETNMGQTLSGWVYQSTILWWWFVHYST
jgi:hypothetical protein